MSDDRRGRGWTRFWVEAGLATGTAALAALTVISQEWVELVFRVDPDHGSGALEWLVVAVLLAATVTFGLLARLELHRRAVPA